MSRTIRARVGRGMLKPLEKLDLPEGVEVTITIVDAPFAEDAEAFRRAAGSGSGPIDADRVIRDIDADRLIATRPGTVQGGEDAMGPRTPRLSYPDRKISETLLHFAAPLLHDLPSEAPEQRAEEALRIAFTAWNAVIFADVLNDDRHVRKLRGLLAHKPEVSRLMEQLIARKRELFGDDQRLIGTWEVTRTTVGINLRADARDPYTVPRDPQ